VAGAALTPELALDYLDELSADIDAAVVLDRSNGLAAASDQDAERAERMRALAAELLDRTTEAGGGADQVEVATDRGSVFAVRGEHWSLAVVTGRRALPSLMFYDLRSVIRDLGEPA
jgi:hypothetical protein